MAAISAVDDARVESAVPSGPILKPRTDVVSESAVGQIMQVAKLLFEISDYVPRSLETAPAPRFESPLEAGVDIRIVKFLWPPGAFPSWTQPRFARVLKPFDEPGQRVVSHVYRS